MKAIVAVDRNWGIGRNNNLLFRIPADMKFFRETTAGKVVVMGLNTLRSFPGGKPLPNRVNLVLSDVQLPEEENLTVCRSLEELRSALSRFPTEDIFVIGGASIYRQLLPYCSEALVTRVSADGNATVFFPNLSRKKEWRWSEISASIVTNDLTIRFFTYKNNKVKPFLSEIPGQK
ncbi:MAG: dihydrofolate reductase [Eubacteriales bacterium]|nr:dihydrofolate reductase [Eubacteriales bacterium]